VAFREETSSELLLKPFFTNLRFTHLGLGTFSTLKGTRTRLAKVAKNKMLKTTMRRVEPPSKYNNVEIPHFVIG
jgi:hypothetical protein